MPGDIVIAHAELSGFCSRLLQAARVDEEKADLVARSLVAANLRGVDSHGAQLLPFYIEQIEAGLVNPAATGRVVSESGGCLLYDGENGIGQVVAQICTGHAARLAREHGISIVVARESNHFGAAAFWAQQLSDEGLIGIILCNASPQVPPWQGRERRLGTNPICVSTPGERLWLLDMATTTVAMGKILKAHLTGQATIPEGWAMNLDGIPTTNTEEALNGLPMPLGGYKGSGLAMMAEILGAVLGGGAISTELGGIRIRSRTMRVSQTFIGIDVARFMPVETFVERLARLREIIKSTQTAPGYDEVLVAGEPEWREEEVRRAQGIPISAGIWETLMAVAARLNVPVGCQSS
jgi:LDH2 family malate/lactate/ureidoglycolate dehydrogenase